MLPAFLKQPVNLPVWTNSNLLAKAYFASLGLLAATAITVFIAMIFGGIAYTAAHACGINMDICTATVIGLFLRSFVVPVEFI